MEPLSSWVLHDERAYQCLAKLSLPLPEEVDQCLQLLKARRPSGQDTIQWGWSREVHPVTKVEATILTPVKSQSPNKFQRPSPQSNSLTPQFAASPSDWQLVLTPSQASSHAEADALVETMAKKVEGISKAAVVEVAVCAAASRETVNARSYAWTQLDAKRAELEQLSEASVRATQMLKSESLEKSERLQQALAHAHEQTVVASDRGKELERVKRMLAERDEQLQASRSRADGLQAQVDVLIKEISRRRVQLLSYGARPPTTQSS
eukprot:TRINITY_DN4055_c0_g1_i14.p1 TRINITY_DN4055_c0_g1~~TRINITY_DN4055_c0_g1_i14.p1  ORF type:complete len:265 (+),score=69.22 TRINITY_DN4055_c0_g1_i14:1080-1874(+)